MVKTLQLKIQLQDIKPKMWRRFLVEDDISFETLHDIIQIVMGWENYHMYEFQVDEHSIMSDEAFNPAEEMMPQISQSPEFQKSPPKAISRGEETLDSKKLNEVYKQHKKRKVKFTLKTKLHKLISVGKKFSYVYDFGDDWHHTITVEKFLDEKCSPKCLEGARACPPEDCGGVPGYEELLEIKKNKNHLLYQERITDWLGEEFDFETFDIDKINEELEDFLSGGRSLWSGDVAETIHDHTLQEKLKTFHMNHDEDVVYDCKECHTKISAHNRDWHNNLCDNCFNKMIDNE